MSTQDIYNYRQVNEHFLTGGQPTVEQLQAAATEGIVNVINLAPTTSQNALPDEAGLVESLGMRYYYIPVVWSNPTASDFAAFVAVMQHLPSEKTLLHCQANFRATAFYALYALKHLGWSEAAAEALRASIWAGSDYPIWEAFIQEIKAQAP